MPSNIEGWDERFLNDEDTGMAISTIFRCYGEIADQLGVKVNPEMGDWLKSNIIKYISTLLSAQRAEDAGRARKFDVNLWMRNVYGFTDEQTVPVGDVEDAMGQLSYDIARSIEGVKGE